MKTWMIGAPGRRPRYTLPRRKTSDATIMTTSTRLATGLINCIIILYPDQVMLIKLSCYFCLRVPRFPFSFNTFSYLLCSFATFQAFPVINCHPETALVPPPFSSTFLPFSIKQPRDSGSANTPSINCPASLIRSASHLSFVLWFSFQHVPTPCFIPFILWSFNIFFGGPLLDISGFQVA